MPVYHYKGLRPNGLKAVGIVDADSVRTARQKLRQGGIYPTAVVEQAAFHSTPGASKPGAARAGAPSRTKTFASHDLPIFTRQLATLLVAGLPLVEALTVSVDQSGNKSIQAMLADVREQIRAGTPFSVALERYPKDFPRIYIHMVRAGEASGALDGILVRLADFLDNQAALKSKVTNAVLYPVLMLIVGIAILFFLMTFVVPKITAVFADLNQVLPWPTRALIAASGFLHDWWFLIVGAGLLLVAGFKRFRGSAAGRATLDGLQLKMVVLGEVARRIAVSRLAGTLATMLGSGVQLLDALDISKPVMNNLVLERAVEVARQNIREGESIAEPLKRSGVFPPLVTHMIAVGEKSGELEEMLRRIAQIYDAEVDRVITRATSLLEPLMILAMGIVVFFIVIAILLPIFEMSQMAR